MAGSFTAVAGGADYVLVPEKKADIEELIAKTKRALSDKGFAVVVVSEGAVLDESMLKDRPVDEFGHVQLGGMGEVVAQFLEKSLNTEVKCVILGHAQRGGKPSVIDRILPQLQALKAVEWLDKGQTGVLAAYKEGTISRLILHWLWGKTGLFLSL